MGEQGLALKLGIVGLGVIGRAVQEAARCETVGVDKGDSLSRLLGCNAIAICVGTPARKDGSCDTDALESVLRLLGPYDGTIVCHSTAPPAFYARHARPNLVHVPEFVRAKHAAWEYARQQRMLIGGDPRVASRVFQLWRTWLCPNLRGYVQMTPASAAMAKYVANTLLATKVALLNELKPLAEAVGADWGQIVGALCTDERLGPTHWQVPGPDGKLGFGGSCFPKDLASLQVQGAENGHALEILAAVLRSNEAVRC